jgi:DNA-binding MarR family transcriptional regulator
MHRSRDVLAAALVDLIRFINDPRQDWRMMAEAGLDLDPAFLPLLVMLGGKGEAGVVELAAHTGRDHSTTSRQLSKLETAGLVMRATSPADGRVRTAHVTPEGKAALEALSAARERLLDRVLADWSPADREALGQLLGRFADALNTAVKTAPTASPPSVKSRRAGA